MRHNVLTTLNKCAASFILLGAALASSQTSSAPSSLACSNTTILGAETDTCTVVMSPTPTSSTVVTLSSDNPAVTLPASVAVPANTRSLQFPAGVSAVLTAQVADLTASTGAGSTTDTLKLQAATRVLAVTTSSVKFPAQIVNTSSAPMAVTVHSSGSMPVTLNATVTGSGFSIVNTALPMIVAPYSNATIYVEFSPVAATASSGALTITNNGTGSSGLSASVPLTGTGLASGGVSGESCL